jgi:hypothetical protein
MRLVLPLIALAVMLSGCDETTAPRDVRPPAAPRGFQSITGDRQVLLQWLPNTEADLAGYRVYAADCASGTGCPYSLIGATEGTSYVVRGLANGVTKYFAIAAYDASGNESDLTYADVFDTPRPEGSLRLQSVQINPARSGWDLSAFAVVPSSSPNVDLVFSDDSTTYEMVAPFTDTDIQDAGFATSLDAVDFAPTDGWSLTGTVELVPGHCYVVWTRDDHYAKFRVTGLSTGQLALDWAYQIDTGNRELKAKRPPADGDRVRRDRPLAVR